MDLQEALTMIKADPNCKISGDDSVLFIYRKINEADVYFISKQKLKTINFDAAFKVANKKPELWDAITGGNRFLPDYTTANKYTTIPMMLAANGSAFIIFRTTAKKDNKVGAAGNYYV